VAARERADHAEEKRKMFGDAPAQQANTDAKIDQEKTIDTDQQETADKSFDQYTDEEFEQFTIKSYEEYDNFEATLSYNEKWLLGELQAQVDKWSAKLGVPSPKVSVSREFPAQLSDAGAFYNAGAGFGSRIVFLYSKFEIASHGTASRVGKTMESLGHEFGHHVKREILNNASDTEKASIKKAYHDWIVGIVKAGMTAGEAMADRKAPLSQKDLESLGKFLNLFPDKEYAVSFDEWVADQTSRYLMGKELDTDNKEAVSLIARIAEALRALYREITGKELGKAPAKEMQEFFDKLWYRRDERGLPLTQSSQTAAATRKDRIISSGSPLERWSLDPYKDRADKTFGSEAAGWNSVSKLWQNYVQNVVKDTKGKLPPTAKMQADFEKNVDWKPVYYDAVAKEAAKIMEDAKETPATARGQRVAAVLKLARDSRHDLSMDAVETQKLMTPYHDQIAELEGMLDSLDGSSLEADIRLAMETQEKLNELKSNPPQPVTKGAERVAATRAELTGRELELFDRAMASPSVWGRGRPKFSDIATDSKKKLEELEKTIESLADATDADSVEKRKAAEVARDEWCYYVWRQLSDDAARERFDEVFFPRFETPWEGVDKPMPKKDAGEIPGANQFAKKAEKPKDIAGRLEQLRELINNYTGILSKFAKRRESAGESFEQGLRTFIREAAAVLGVEGPLTSRAAPTAWKLAQMGAVQSLEREALLSGVRAFVKRYNETFGGGRLGPDATGVYVVGDDNKRMISDEAVNAALHIMNAMKAAQWMLLERRHGPVEKWSEAYAAGSFEFKYPGGFALKPNPEQLKKRAKRAADAADVTDLASEPGQIAMALWRWLVQPLELNLKLKDDGSVVIYRMTRDEAAKLKEENEKVYVAADLPQEFLELVQAAYDSGAIDGSTNGYVTGLPPNETGWREPLGIRASRRQNDRIPVDPLLVPYTFTAKMRVVGEEARGAFGVTSPAYISTPNPSRVKIANAVNSISAMGRRFARKISDRLQALHAGFSAYEGRSLLTGETVATILRDDKGAPRRIRLGDALAYVRGAHTQALRERRTAAEEARLAARKKLDRALSFFHLSNEEIWDLKNDKTGTAAGLKSKLFKAQMKKMAGFYRSAQATQAFTPDKETGWLVDLVREAITAFEEAYPDANHDARTGLQEIRKRMMVDARDKNGMVKLEDLQDGQLIVFKMMQELPSQAFTPDVDLKKVEALCRVKVYGNTKYAVVLNEKFEEQTDADGDVIGFPMMSETDTEYLRIQMEIDTLSEQLNPSKPESYGGPILVEGSPEWQAATDRLQTLLNASTEAKYVAFPNFIEFFNKNNVDQFEQAFVDAATARHDAEHGFEVSAVVNTIQEDGSVVYKLRTVDMSSGVPVVSEVLLDADENVSPETIALLQTGNKAQKELARELRKAHKEALKGKRQQAIPGETGVTKAAVWQGMATRLGRIIESFIPHATKTNRRQARLAAWIKDTEFSTFTPEEIVSKAEDVGFGGPIAVPIIQHIMDSLQGNQTNVGVAVVQAMDAAGVMTGKRAGLVDQTVDAINEIIAYAKSKEFTADRTEVMSEDVEAAVGVEMSEAVSDLLVSMEEDGRTVLSSLEDRLARRGLHDEAQQAEALIEEYDEIFDNTEGEERDMALQAFWGTATQEGHLEELFAALENPLGSSIENDLLAVMQEWNTALSREEALEVIKEFIEARDQVAVSREHVETMPPGVERDREYGKLEHLKSLAALLWRNIFNTPEFRRVMDNYRLLQAANMPEASASFMDMLTGKKPLGKGLQKALYSLLKNKQNIIKSPRSADLNIADYSTVIHEDSTVGVTTVQSSEIFALIEKKRSLENDLAKSDKAAYLIKREIPKINKQIEEKRSLENDLLNAKSDRAVYFIKREIAQVNKLIEKKRSMENDLAKSDEAVRSIKREIAKVNKQIEMAPVDRKKFDELRGKFKEKQAELLATPVAEKEARKKILDELKDLRKQINDAPKIPEGYISHGKIILTPMTDEAGRQQAAADRAAKPESTFVPTDYSDVRADNAEILARGRSLKAKLDALEAEYAEARRNDIPAGDLALKMLLMQKELQSVLGELRTASLAREDNIHGKFYFKFDEQLENTLNPSLNLKGFLETQFYQYVRDFLMTQNDPRLAGVWESIKNNDGKHKVEIDVYTSLATPSATATPKIRVRVYGLEAADTQQKEAPKRTGGQPQKVPSQGTPQGKVLQPTFGDSPQFIDPQASRSIDLSTERKNAPKMKATVAFTFNLVPTRDPVGSAITSSMGIEKHREVGPETKETVVTDPHDLTKRISTAFGYREARDPMPRNVLNALQSSVGPGGAGANLGIIIKETTPKANKNFSATTKISWDGGKTYETYVINEEPAPISYLNDPQAVESSLKEADRPYFDRRMSITEALQVAGVKTMTFRLADSPAGIPKPGTSKVDTAKAQSEATRILHTSVGNRDLNVYVIDSFDVLDPSTKKEIELENRAEDVPLVKSWIIGNDIYIFADRHFDNLDVIKSVLHESIAHRGLRETFSGTPAFSKKLGTYDAFLKSVQMAYKAEWTAAFDRVKVTYSQYDQSRNGFNGTDEGRKQFLEAAATASEEVVASLIESAEVDAKGRIINKQIGTYFDRMVSLIIKALRSLGIWKPQHWSQTEIRAMLRYAYKGRNVKYGWGLEGALRRLMDPQTTPGLAAFQHYAMKASDHVMEKLQGAHRALWKFEHSLAKSGVEITDKMKAYDRLGLVRSRISAQQRLVLKLKHFDPLMAEMKKLGIVKKDNPYGALNTYIHEWCSTRDPDNPAKLMPGVLSQVTLPPGVTHKQMFELMKRLDAMNRDSLQIAFDGGLISKTEFDEKSKLGWKAGDVTLRLQPYKVPRASQAAKDKRAGRYVESASRGLEYFIAQAHMNDVNDSILSMLEALPENPRIGKENFFSTSEPKKLDPALAATFEVDTADHAPEGQFVVYRDGQRIEVNLHHKYLARAINALHPTKVNAVLRGIQTMNRLLARLFITDNMFFWPKNFMRDTQTALSHLYVGGKAMGLPEDVTKQVAKRIKPAVRAIWGYYRGKDKGFFGNYGISKESYDFAEKNGVFTGYYTLTTADAQGLFSGLESEGRKWSSDMWKSEAAFRRGWEAYNHFVTSANRAMENASRLALVDYLLQQKDENGKRLYSDNRIAILAKDLTTNFDRRGNDTVMNSLFLFFNATFQGQGANVKWLSANPKKARNMMIGLAVQGFVMAELLRLGLGEDDDGEDRADKISEYHKSTSALVGFGDDLFKFPLPYGPLALAWNMGRKISDVVHGQNPMVASFELMDNYFHNFVPIDSGVDWGSVENPQRMLPAGASMALAPTFLKAPMQLLFNTSRYGRAIYHPDDEFSQQLADGAAFLIQGWGGGTGKFYTEMLPATMSSIAHGTYSELPMRSKPHHPFVMKVSEQVAQANLGAFYTDRRLLAKVEQKIGFHTAAAKVAGSQEIEREKPPSESMLVRHYSYRPEVIQRNLEQYMRWRMNIS